ncbi:MAG TPA: glycosyltransferase, partial [Tepidisphaeraceae bacterium]
MKPLRVLFLATYFPKPGRETMGVWALKPMVALQRQGVVVQVVSLTSWLPRFLSPWLGKYRAWAECPAEHRFENVHVNYPRWLFYQFGKLKQWDFRRPALQHRIAWWSVRRRLLKLVRKFQPDVIYAHHTWVNGDIAHRLHKSLGIPYVLTDQDFGEIEECHHLPARRRFFGPIIRDAAAVVPVAMRMKRHLQQLFPGVLPIVIPNGAEPLPAEYTANPRPPELRDKTIVLCVAVFYDRKDIPLLIRTFDRVAEKHPTAILRIVGDGPERPAVEKVLSETTHRDRIELLGAQPHERVLQEMAWADFFALIGWDEPCATVYLESLSAGLPILCCNDGGINDVLMNETHGLTIPPHDETAAVAAMDRLLSDPQLRE